MLLFFFFLLSFFFFLFVLHVSLFLFSVSVIIRALFHLITPLIPRSFTTPVFFFAVFFVAVVPLPNDPRSRVLPRTGRHASVSTRAKVGTVPNIGQSMI